MHLQGGQASAIVLMHSFDHVVDKLLDSRGWIDQEALVLLPGGDRMPGRATLYHRRRTPSC